jgi:hypothetical protein
MKTLLLITSLLFSTAFSFAANGHVIVNVEVESERGKKDTDKNSKTPDESRSHWLVVRL